MNTRTANHTFNHLGLDLPTIITSQQEENSSDHYTAESDALGIAAIGVGEDHDSATQDAIEAVISMLDCVHTLNRSQYEGFVKKHWPSVDLSVLKRFTPIHVVTLNVPKCHHKTVDELLVAAMDFLRGEITDRRRQDPTIQFRLVLSVEHKP